MVNRFDYDGIYGTVLNRFISQAANNQPLTVYGTGGQSRAFIHVTDTARCIELALTKTSDFETGKVRVFNQISEVRRVKDLAQIIAEKYGSEVNYVENPRNELAENELEVSNDGLKSLGFDPVLLKDELLDDINTIASGLEKNFDKSSVMNSPKWN